jgi:FkbM family methyltransferase
MLHRPLPIGEHHTLVQLKSGEYICVDTRSLDSIAYLLGWELEGDVIRVLRTFLTQQSVVLDIGANVGLYTALVASIVKQHGRLFAFEGNPRVFAALQRTLVANEVIENPNIIAANLLVSDRSGRGTLHYTEEWPVGGTMSDIPLMGQERHSVEVAMTTIDDYLPHDLAVDLVKIDVEGQEPAVIRGMQQTIARSPNIRLIIEFADHMLKHSGDPAEFVDDVRRLGFHILRIRRRFKVDRVLPGEAITGFNYCLLTRTPDEDIAAVERRRNELPIRLKRWLHRISPRWGRWRRIWHRW